MRRRKDQRGFTLLELLVVVAISALIIGMLIPSLKRSVRMASATICMHNLREIGHGLALYRIENGGWLPSGGRPDGSWTGATPRDFWFLRLFPAYLPDPTVLMCPDDPFRYWFLRARVGNDRELVPDYASYGINGFIMNARGGYLANLDRHRAPQPLQTILLADQGPDDAPRHRLRGEGASGRFRNASRLPVDDGFDPFAAQPDAPWITARHGYGINMLTVDGHNVREVSTLEVIRTPNQRYYWDCASAGCTLCSAQVAHYSFHRSRLYWWTGPLPTD